MSNFNNTGEVKEISILDMMNGAIGERAAYELTRIMKNCRDFNTEAKKARTLTIKLSIVPTENRDSVAVRAEVSSKLVPVKPIDGALLLGGGCGTHRYGVHAAGARSTVVRPVR